MYLIHNTLLSYYIRAKSQVLANIRHKLSTDVINNNIKGLRFCRKYKNLRRHIQKREEILRANKYKNRHKISLSVFVFLVRDNHILLLKRNNTGWMDGHYDVPSGALDEGETILQAAVRETKEEVGVVVSESDLSLVHTMHNKINGEWLGCYFMACDWSGDVNLCEPDKHSEIVWVPIGKLPENTVPYVRRALSKSILQASYSEFGWETDIEV